MGHAYIVLLLYWTKISDLSFNIQMLNVDFFDGVDYTDWFLNEIIAVDEVIIYSGGNVIVLYNL